MCCGETGVEGEIERGFGRGSVCLREKERKSDADNVREAERNRVFVWENLYVKVLCNSSPNRTLVPTAKTHSTPTATHAHLHPHPNSYTFQHSHLNPDPDPDLDPHTHIQTYTHIHNHTHTRTTAEVDLHMMLHAVYLYVCIFIYI